MNDDDEVAQHAKEVRDRLDEDVPSPGGAIIDSKRYRPRYTKTKVKVGGKVRHGLDNDDKVAVALRGKTAIDIKRIAKKNGLGRYVETYDHLNDGQIRMAVGHRLRTLVKDGIPITIGAILIETL